MTRFWRQSKSYIILLSICVSVFMGGCHTADEYFGNDFIPDDEHMSTQLDTAEVIGTYYAKLDSVYSKSADAAYLGYYVDQIFGGRECGFLTQYAPIGFANDSLFGVDPKADSIKLFIQLGNAIGDTNTVHTIEVYKLTGQLRYDSSYYSNFKPEPIIESTPLMTFQHKGLNQIERFMPLSFGESLLDTTENVYSSDTVFFKKFKGLYIKVKNQNSGGNIFKVHVNTSHISLYYHNNNPNKKDTISQRFLFQNTFAETNYNTSFTVANFDYSLATSPHGVDPQKIGNLTTQTEYTFVQGMGGLYPVVRLDKSYFEGLKAKVKAAGYSHIAVLQAVLFFPLAEPTAVNMDIAPPRLGSYQDINKYKFLPDYNPISEEQNSTATDYDGYIDRSNGQYRINLTSYVQKLITGKLDYWDFKLYTNANSTQSLYQVSLNGSTMKKPRLALTYTMVK